MRIAIASLAFVAACWSSAPRPEPAPSRPPPVITEGVQYVGSPTASVALTYYFDYECPPCLKFADTLHEIERKYGNRIVVHYKNFQLPNHKTARLAAIAAEAARRQGKFFEMHRLLVERAKEAKAAWLDPLRATGTPPAETFTVDGLRELAIKLRLDLARFDRDVADPSAGARVDRELASGEPRNVHSVPALIFGDEAFDEDKRLFAFDDITAAIDARLGP